MNWLLLFLDLASNFYYMIIPNNIPTDLCRDARSLRPLIINKLLFFYFGHTSRVFLLLRVNY